MGEPLTSDEGEPCRRARLGIRLLACAILGVAVLDLASPTNRTFDGAGAFAGLAFALLLASTGSRRSRRASQGVAAGLVLACLLALAHGLGGRELAPLSRLTGESVPPAAAFALALLAWAVVMAPESGALARTVGALIAATGALALLGRLYSVPELARLPATSVADATAALAVAGGLGVLFLRPERGLPAAVLDQTEAGRELRRLLPVALLLPAALGGLVLAGEHAGWFQARLSLALFATALTLALLASAFASFTSLRRSELARRRVASELTASEARYRRTFEQARIGIAHVAPDGRWLRANERLCEILGYAESELLQKTYAEVSHLQDLEIDVKQWELLRRGTIADYGVERRFEAKDGEIVHADVRLVREEDPSGALRHLIVVLQDITGRKLSEGTLRVYERALAATQNGVVITDATQDHQPIAYANPAYLEITGYSAAELIGRNPRILNKGARDQATLDEVRRAVERGEPCSVLLRNHRKNGEAFWNELSIAPVEDAKGRVTHFVGVVIDATERVRALGEREELLGVAEAARREAEAANRAKDRFLSVVSHELRSPLNAILAWTSLLRDGGAQQDLGRAVDSIEASVQAQTRLVDDLLDASRIRGGTLEIEPARVDLAAVVRRAASHLEPVAREQGVAFTVQANGPAPAVADAQRIEQVVRNLLDNAFAATPRGGRVAVELSACDAGWRIDVADDGAGIPAEALPRVFDEFWQGERRQGGRGLGLGLVIVKHLVERHGGAVRIESDGPERGTRVRVELPKAAGGASGSGAAELAGLDVLVVEDDAATLEALGTALVRGGVRARVGRSVSEAQALLAERPADVLVSDIGLPDRDGFDLIRAVRADPSTAATLAIAVTGLVEPEERRRIRRAGFDAYLAKPARPDVVLDRIGKLRALQRAPAPPARRVLVLDPAGPDGELAARLLQLGHEVRTAQHADEAVDEAPSFAPQLVLVRAAADLDAAALADRLAARGVRADLVGLLAAGAEPDLRAFDRVLPAPLDLGALDRALRFAEET